MADESKPKLITTNTIEAPRPAYPAEGQRQPATGPVITTGNIEEIKRQYAETETKTEPAPLTEEEPGSESKAKRGRSKKG